MANQFGAQRLAGALAATNNTDLLLTNRRGTLIKTKSALLITVHNS